MSEKINFDYNKMTPFKWYIIENYPFLEDSIDEMTNYRLLVKLGDEINKNRDTINELGLNAEALTEGYNSLVDYVNNYFDNLDVQDEINQKLDELTEDGTLSNLISAYIQPRINAQNENIENFENEVTNTLNNYNNRISAIASGSPLKATSISEMTNTNRIYVNTTDGNWYYYDGSSWQIGGTYQSSGIADGSITFLSLDSNLKGNFNFDLGENLVSQQLNSVYYSKDANTGKIKSTNANNYSSYIYPLEAGKNYFFVGFNRYGLSGLLIADSEDNVIYQSPVTDSSTVTGSSYLFSVNQSGLKAYINRGSTTMYTVWYDYYNTKLCEINNIYNNFNIKENVTLFNNLTDLYVNLNDVQLNNTIKFRSAENYNIKVYKISKGLKYTIRSKDIYLVPGIILTNSDYSVIYSSSTENQPTARDVTYTFIAENDGFAFLPEIENNNIYHTITIDYDIINVESKMNNLENKIVLWNGDSICKGAGNNGVSYADYIADKYNMSSTNYAVSGRCIAKEEGQTSILESINNMSNNADYVLFEGGWNDMWRVPLGTISEGYDATLDEYTWSGALESLIKTAKMKWPTARIGFILPHGRVDNMRETEDHYWDRAIEIFNKWNFPYIDLRHNGLVAFNDTLLDLFFGISETTQHGDGTHPNELGYKTFYNNPIAKFMNRL